MLRPELRSYTRAKYLSKVHFYGLVFTHKQQDTKGKSLKLSIKNVFNFKVDKIVLFKIEAIRFVHPVSLIFL